jgi:2-C-methyl-D-erythritol 2,4-cyclodiphosphate synthase
MNVRVGFGYDVHQLAVGHELWLGGIKIESEKGAVGHSDADVLIHVICDALLGAAGMRDIGFHFPDTDATYKGIDSKILLTRVVELLDKENYSIGNIDCTVVMENPKLNPHIEKMKQTLAKILKINTTEIGIKATTNEKLGYLGKEDGVCAYCVTLIGKN